MSADCTRPRKNSSSKNGAPTATISASTTAVTVLLVNPLVSDVPRTVLVGSSGMNGATSTTVASRPMNAARRPTPTSWARIPLNPSSRSDPWP